MKKILNIGSCNLDDVYAVPHFVQAGETMASLSVQHFPGGKGLNQSVALARAEGCVYHAGRIAPDGLMLRQVLEDAGVNVDLLDTTAQETGRAIIQIDPKGQNCILLSPGGNHAIDKAFIDQTLASFEAGDVLVLQNEISNVAYAMEQAAAKGMEIAFNPSPMTPQLLEYPLHLVKWFLLNEVEGKSLSGETQPSDIIHTMGKMYPNAVIVQTVGKDGVLCLDGQETYTHGVYRVPVVDTTAAGDTFTGFFISLVVSGQTVPEAIRLASIASSIAVSRQGAAVSIPTLEEVQHSSLQLEA